MRFPVRHRWTLLGVSLFAAFPALSASPNWATETIVDMWEYPASERTIRAESNRQVELQSESEFVLHRIRVKESILDEVESGRMTLRDAANRFRAMDADRPEIAVVLYPNERLGSADEIAAQSVIRHLRTRVRGGRPQTARAMDDVIAEFESAYGYDPSNGETE